jgi:nitrate reductase beta subunit
LADDQDLYQAQLDLMLDPTDPEVIADARRSGIPEDWLDAAAKSPVYALIKHFKVALPLHPEYRTMPMVWYIPPLSPVVDLLKDQGHDAEAGATCSERSTPCASRWSTWPSCSPQATSTWCATCCRSWRPCAPTCAT